MNFPIQETLSRCTQIAAQLQQATQLSAQYGCLIMAVAYVHNHLHLNPSLDEVADAVNLPIRKFSVLFRRATGVPPARYIKWLQMETARQLLANGLPTSEVMARVGIKDPSHFSRDFLQYYGLRPAQYRAYCQHHLNNRDFAGE